MSRQQLRISTCFLLFLLSFLQVRAVDYFWVGGSGNWSDVGHWARSSGGTTFHTQPPTSRDNVFFDAASFTGPGQVVTIDLPEAICRDMIWTGATGAPQLAGAGDRILRVFGSLTLVPDLVLAFLGEFRFQSEAVGPLNRILTSAGRTFPANIYFDGQDGQWSLADSLAVAQTIFFERGTLNTSNRPLSCGGFISDNNRSRRIDLTRSTMYLRRMIGAEPLVWRLRAENLLFQARSATIIFLNETDVFNEGSGRVEYHRLLFTDIMRFRRSNFTTVSADTLRLGSYGTFLNGLTMTSLGLSRGYEYRFASDATFIIRELVAEGGCGGFVSMRSTIPGRAAFLASAFNFNNNYLILQDLHNTGSTVFRADNSIDLGNTQGWTINSPAPRILYWVAGTGEWYDPAHWSLSSGGAGGECPPTPLDDVFFDANSFTGPDQVVQGSLGPQYYCEDMSWRNAGGVPRFELANLQLFGSLELNPAMVTRLPELQLRSSAANRSLQFHGQPLQDIIADGAGGWIFQDSLSAVTLTLLRGSLNTNGAPLRLRRLSALQAEPVKELLLGASRIEILGEGAPTPSWNISNANLRILPGSSVLIFSHPSARMLTNLSSGTASYNEVRFTDGAGTGVVESVATTPVFGLLRMEGNGVILGSHEFGALEFSSGKTYQLGAGATQTIRDRWELSGNPCGVINLNSTAAGAQALVRSAGAAIRASYVDMRDQQAGGGANFNAGPGSRNLSNNSGWTFPNTQSEGLLGPDRLICAAAPAVLDPGIGNQGQTYRWSNGAITPTIQAGQAGVYSVLISFPGNCELRDTIRLIGPEALNPPFGADTSLCAGQSISLNAEINLPAGIPVSYRWQDGSSSPTFTARQSGRLEVTISAGACAQTSAIQVNVVTPPQVELGPDQEGCAGDQIVLNATTAGATSYRWSTGETSPVISVSGPGRYTVEASIGACSKSDSLRVVFRPVPVIDLGENRTLCQGDTLLLDATNAGATYRWSNGMTTPTISATRSGTYDVIVDLNGCQSGDAVELTFRPQPQFELGADRNACEGESVSLDGTASSGTGVQYQWNTGSTSPVLTVNQSGLYRLTASLNGCSRTDSLRVAINPFPVVDLGPDRQLCAGEPFLLDAFVNNGVYNWNTGAQSPSLSPTQSGVYAVTVTALGCSTSDSVSITIQPQPSFDLGPDQRLCQGQMLTLDGVSSNGADSYRWNDGIETPVRPVRLSGTYTLEAILGACTKTDTVLVEFIDLPTNILGEDRFLCRGDQLALNAQVPYADAVYRWTGGQSGPRLNINSGGTYRVDIQVGQCQSSDEVNVTIQERPFFSLGDNAELCEGETYDLVIDAQGDRYLWSDGSNKDAIRIGFPGGLIWGEVSRNGCSFRDSIRITFQALPRLQLGPDTAVCEERPLTLRVPSGPGTVTWSTGAQGPRSILVAQPGTYWAEIADGICLARDTIVLSPRECTFFKAFIPNVFSPDGDGVNDDFRPFLPEALRISTYRFTILDRWGNQVFLSTDPNAAWNGSRGGRNLPSGVYVYVLEIEYEDDDGPDQAIESGDVLLLR